MENYQSSIEIICSLNQLFLEPEIIKKIRYFCNGSIDITGYTNIELIRFLSKCNEERFTLLNTKSRSEIIRMLYDNKIHIKPKQKKEEPLSYQLHPYHYSRFIPIYDFLATKNVSPCYSPLKIGFSFQYYNYTFTIEKISYHHIFLHTSKTIGNNSISHICKIDKRLYNFILHNIRLSKNPNTGIICYLFGLSSYNHFKSYIDILHNLNITKENIINYQFIYDCINEAIEFIDFELLTHGKHS